MPGEWHNLDNQPSYYHLKEEQFCRILVVH